MEIEPEAEKVYSKSQNRVHCSSVEYFQKGWSTNVCAVATCPNPYGESYHRFPKKSELRSKWIQACRRADKLNPDTAKICGRHFQADDFQRDMRNELLGLPQQRRLKIDVVPSMNLPHSTVAAVAVTARSDRALRRHTSERVSSQDTLVAEVTPYPEDGQDLSNSVDGSNDVGTIEHSLREQVKQLTKANQKLTVLLKRKSSILWSVCYLLYHK